MRHQPISLDMKRRRLQMGLPCVWSGGRQPPPSATLSPRSPADCLPLNRRLSSSSAPSGFCLSFGSSSSPVFSSSSSTLCLSLRDSRDWAFPQLSSGSLSELERTTHARSVSVEGAGRGLGGAEPAEKEGEGKEKKDEDYFIGRVAECNQTLKSFIPWREIHHLKSVTVWQNDCWHESKTQHGSLGMLLAILAPMLTIVGDVIV